MHFLVLKQNYSSSGEAERLQILLIVTLFSDLKVRRKKRITEHLFIH
jgi:hypothetical protein